MMRLTTILLLVCWSASGANLIYNSGFELGGMGHSSARQKLGYDSFAENGILTANAKSGSYGFTIPPEDGNIYYTRLIQLPLLTATNYTLSFWAKADTDANFVLLQVGTYGNLSSFTNTGFLPSAASWTRYSTTLYVNPTNSSEFQVGISWAHNRALWIDDIQLELGSTATTYAPKDVVEIGWIGDRLGHVIVPGMDKRAGLRLYSTTATNGTVKVEMQDWLNKTVISLTTNLSLSPGLVTNWFPLPNSNGAFRVVARWNGGGNTPAESLFTVLPTPPATNNFFGGHNPSSAYMMEYWRTNTGLVWTRSLSPAAFFRWSTIEPTEGAFNWTATDTAVDSQTNGIIFASISGSATTFPAWALTNGYMPDLVKWSNYVYQVVDRYKDRISYWEDINEPSAEITTNDLAILLPMTVSVVKDLQPTAYFVALGGVGEAVRDTAYAAGVWAQLSDPIKAKIDAFSVHLYPPSGSDWSNPQFDAGYDVWRTQSAAWGKPVWETETAGVTRHQLRTIAYWTRPESELWRGVHWDPIWRSTVPFIRSAGYGFAKHFYYDTRSPYAESDMGTTQDNLWNKDESLGTAGASLFWAANLLGDPPVAGGQLNHSGASGAIDAELFVANGTNAVIAMWSEEKRSRTITFTNSYFSVYDTMGNVVQTNVAAVNLGILPIYIVSDTLNTNALANAYLSGTIVTNTDAIAPYATIDETPYGTVASGSLVRCRWLAWDNLSLNDSVSTTRLQTRYSLTNGTWSSWSGSVRTFGPAVLPNGTYILNIESKDEIGNTSSVSGPTFVVGTPVVGRPIVTTPGKLTIIGKVTL